MPGAVPGVLLQCAGVLVVRPGDPVWPPGLRVPQADEVADREPAHADAAEVGVGPVAANGNLERVGAVQDLMGCLGGGLVLAALRVLDNVRKQRLDTGPNVGHALVSE